MMNARIQSTQTAQLHADLASLTRQIRTIARIMERREPFLEALDWSAMTLDDLCRADGHGLDLHHDLWVLDAAMETTMLALFSQSG